MRLGQSGFEHKTKITRRRELLEKMNPVMLWTEPESLTASHAPAPDAEGGSPSFAVESMLRIHFIQQWFTLSDTVMEGALYNIALLCEFVGLDAGEDKLPDESAILCSFYLLEARNLSRQILPTINSTLAAKELRLKSGAVVDATLITAPSTTKNSSGESDPEMRRTKKVSQWHFCMKAHIDVDAESGPVHTAVGTAAFVNDTAHALAHGEETNVFADAGYQCVGKRDETQDIQVNSHVALRSGKRRVMEKCPPMDMILNQLEQIKARIRVKVEHPFRVINRQFGHVKVRCRGQAKNTMQLNTLFALSNRWIARRTLLQELRG